MTFPYEDRFAVHRTFPEQGSPRDEVLAELQVMAAVEDEVWEGGRCSGTPYSGDRDHYRFMTEAFGHFGHVDVHRRDLCPSATKFEAEIVAMTLDLLQGEAVAGTAPAGLVTGGGTSSIAHAVLAYREHGAQARGVDRPNLVVPETAHPAFDKACHLFGVTLRRAPVDPVTTEVDVAWVADHVDDQTLAVVGSACSHGYGTVDPVAALSDVALDRGVGLHVDGCLGAYILPFGQELGYEVPVFDYRVPGVTSISADAHKYGYALEGTSVLTFRDKAVRNAQYFYRTDWSGGRYSSPGMDGSRSGGLLAATWATMVQLGREGYRRYAQQIFSTARALQEAVRAHPELRIIGRPTVLFAFASDEIDVYLANDFLHARGWRLGGQQFPDALRMAVTRPQTGDGVVDAFAADLDEAVAYAHRHHGEPSQTGAVHGGVAGGTAGESDALVRAAMADLMDAQSAVPASG